MASFLAFFMFGHDGNIASADEKCALAVHDATRNATRNQCTRFLIHTTDIKHRSRPGMVYRVKYEASACSTEVALQLLGCTPARAAHCVKDAAGTAIRTLVLDAAG